MDEQQVGQEEPEIMCEHLVIVDVQELFFAVKKTFGKDSKVDFVKLQEYVRYLIRDPEVDNYRFIAYIVTGDKSEAFIRTLKSFDYEVVMRRRKPNTPQVNLSVNMALDILEEVYTNDELKRVVVASSAEFMIPLSRFTELHEVSLEILFPKDRVLEIVSRVANKSHVLPSSILLTDDF